MRQPILIELLAGQGAHVDPLAMVRATDASLAGRVLPGASHTVWQLVWHLDYWMDYELRSLEGREPPYPRHAAESWPPTPAPLTAADWGAEQERFGRQLAGLKEWAARLEDPAVAGRLIHTAKQETVTDVLWQMAAHNSYHSGQIAMLLRAFGAWPPAGGGDTW
jgi:uncharacterized damage-inducible protein DinB